MQFGIRESGREPGRRKMVWLGTGGTGDRKQAGLVVECGVVLKFTRRADIP